MVDTGKPQWTMTHSVVPRFLWADYQNTISNTASKWLILIMESILTRGIKLGLNKHNEDCIPSRFLLFVKEVCSYEEQKLPLDRKA